MRGPFAAAIAAPACAWSAQRSWDDRLGRLVANHYWACQLFVMALMAINVFWRLSSTAIASMDEARYGVAASEMLSSGQFLVPTYGGSTEYWNLKPPLGYWLIEASYALFGRTVWALRLSSALCALAVVMLTMFFCRRHFGRRAAILAGLFVATCFGFLSSHGARSGDLDAALTLLLLLALIQVPDMRDSARSRLACGLLLTAAFLLKSFAIVPFALAAIIHLNWTTGERIPWRRWLPAVGVFVGIVGAWALLRTLKDGTPYFVIRMTYEDLFMRSTQVIDEGTYSPWGYASSLFDRFAPWPLFVVLGWVYRSRGTPPDAKRATLRLLLLWALVPLCLFSLARTQHHWYLDPTYPAWAILSAVAVLSILKRVEPQFIRGAVLGVVMLGLIACEARFVMRVTGRDSRPGSQVFLSSLGDCVARGTPVYTTFALTHSERFILQVMDGFDVREPAPDAQATIVPAATALQAAKALQAATPLTTAAPLSAAFAGLVLDSRRTGFVALRDPKLQPRVVARGADYLLVDGTYSPATQCGKGVLGTRQPMLAASKAGGGTAAEVDPAGALTE